MTVAYLVSLRFIGMPVFLDLCVSFEWDCDLFVVWLSSRYGVSYFLRSGIRLMCGMAYLSVGNGYFFLSRVSCCWSN